MMLLSQAFSKLLALRDSGRFAALSSDRIWDRVPLVLLQLLRSALRNQSRKGSWGNSSCEITSYAILTLVAVKANQLPELLHETILNALERGLEFLKDNENAWRESQRIWVEKVSYSSPLLTVTYCLAAMSAASKTLAASGPTPKKQASKLSTMTTFFSPIAMFSQLQEWELMALALESDHYKRQLEFVRLEVFPRDGLSKDKYLDYIPFTWIACSSLESTQVSNHILWEMMLVSMLNYQVDEYMETAVDETVRQSPTAVRACINRVCDMFTRKRQNLDNTEMSTNGKTKQSNFDLRQCRSSEQESTQGFDEDLLRVEAVLSRYAAHFLEHPAVTRSPRQMQDRLETALRTMLHAHVTQIIDNQEFEKQKDQRIFQTSRPYYEWVNTTSADHTSCPFSFLFFCCLIAEPGVSTFHTTKAEYFANAGIRHLATLCRQYNDYGSIARDEAEKNLNSLNFPEFFLPGFDITNRSPETLDKAKTDLLALADFEREGLERALLGLEKEADGNTMGMIRLFVRVTDLYGQVYVAKDIASRVK